MLVLCTPLTFAEPHPVAIATIARSAVTKVMATKIPPRRRRGVSEFLRPFIRSSPCSLYQQAEDLTNVRAVIMKSSHWET